MKADSAELPKVGKIAVDPTDNRLTAILDGKNITDEALDLILKSIEPLGGKRIFVVHDADLKEKFCSRNFHIPAESDRFFELKMRSVSSLDVPEGLMFVMGEELKKYATEKAVLDLSKNSGFLQSKIDQNQAQGCAGFQLMCKYSHVFGMIKDNKLVGFCRLTTLGSNNTYLSDTWVDEKAISKEKGTQLLYSHFVNTANKRVFLIAPTGREEEFKRLGCETPKDVVISFVPKGPGMDRLFQNELAKYGLIQSVRHTH